MNNRRSFFKSLALLGAAAAGCPGLFIPKFEPVRWKAPAKLGWYRAEFKYCILPMAPLYDQVILHLRQDGTPVEVGQHHYPRLVNPDGNKPYYGEWKFQTCDSSILSKCV